MKQRELSLWFKSVTFLGFIIGIICCFVFAPSLLYEALFDEIISYLFWPSLIYLWLSSIPFYISLVFAWKIASEIGKDNSFCEQNATRLKYISKLTLFDAIFFAIGGIALILFDTFISGLFLMLIFMLLASLAISIVCAALSHLTYKAYQMKQENDLTI